MKFIVLALVAAGALFGQGTPAPFVAPQYFLNSGQPNALGALCTYDAGSSTPRATFTDYTLTVNNAQCVPLNVSGRPASGIWMDPARTYRFILKDSGGSTLWTVDGIPGSGTGGSSGGALWTLSGSTVYNSSGTKVCIGATACTSALATLDVAGTTSGTTFPVRIDDTTSATGISLYGAGAALGFYTANASGLQLRSADGTSQLSVAQGNVTVQNAAASGGSLLNIKKSSTQGTVNPFQVQTSTGSVLTYIDPDGVGFFPGLSASGTNTNMIQAPNGGVTAKWLIASDSLFFVEEAQPALPAANQSKIYMDSASHILMVSEAGATFVPLVGGGGSGGSFSGITAGTNTAALVVGNAGTLTFTGTGIIDARKINGTTVPVNSAADEVLLTSASATGSWSAVPDCPDTAQHLNYTHAGGFTCGTTGGTTGAVAFGAITTGENTIPATMTVGNGSSLTFSGTGVVNANTFNNSVAPPSGSVWKSNGSLQPVAAAASDVVAMFSGACSGTAYLAANGTCQIAGSGTYLPLAGGTMQGSIFVNSPNNYDLGSAGIPWRNIYGSGVGSFGTLSSAFGSSLGGVTSISPGATLRINSSSILEISNGGFIRPAFDKGADLAGSSNRFNNGWVAGRLTIGDGSTGGGGFSTGSSTTSEIGAAGTLTMRPSSALQFTSTASITAPNGSVGVTTALSCANINVTISAGIITAASCF